MRCIGELNLKMTLYLASCLTKAGSMFFKTWRISDSCSFFEVVTTVAQQVVGYTHTVGKSLMFHQEVVCVKRLNKFKMNGPSRHAINCQGSILLMTSADLHLKREKTVHTHGVEWVQALRGGYCGTALSRSQGL